jgi:RNA polymerase sigma-70 factor (ECF subfamily)
MGETDIDEALRHEMKTAWQRFLDLIQGERPELYGYCRRLTGTVWDAEDLVQDTLLRAFGTLGKLDFAVRSPRAYLLKLATNAWIDTIRRRQTAEAAQLEPPQGFAEPDMGRSVRDAASQLMTRLAPQERAAFVLKELFGSSLKEIAEILGTTEGAVKSALHRGRKMLEASEESVELEARTSSIRRVPSEELIDRFVSAYNAADLEGLTSLVLANASVEIVGCMLQSGPEALDGEKSWFVNSLGGHPEWPVEFHFEAQRAQCAELEGERIVLVFRTRAGEEALEAVVRLEEEEGRVRRLRTYSFCPETVRAVASELGFTARTGLYRYPTPAPGRSYRDED